MLGNPANANAGRTVGDTYIGPDALVNDYRLFNGDGSLSQKGDTIEVLVPAGSSMSESFSVEANTEVAYWLTGTQFNGPFPVSRPWNTRPGFDTNPANTENNENFQLQISDIGDHAVSTGVTNFTIDDVFRGVGSPISFDLNGDGVQTISIDAGIEFDMLNSGFTVNTGWLSGEDAFLATDDNGNGIIDDRSELFGGAVGEGFAELATFDSNGDGVVNSSDDRFSELLVWQDANENAITDAGELVSLEDTGIASISTEYTDVFSKDAQGNILGEFGSATSVDGNNIEVVDVYFQFGA